MQCYKSLTNRDYVDDSILKLCIVTNIYRSKINNTKRMN